VALCGGAGQSVGGSFGFQFGLAARRFHARALPEQLRGELVADGAQTIERIVPGEA
jgi:hypothetical protein